LQLGRTALQLETRSRRRWLQAFGHYRPETVGGGEDKLPPFLRKRVLWGGYPIGKGDPADQLRIDSRAQT
jgi:hypothetical protein